jgi:hypothetical protein
MIIKEQTMTNNESFRELVGVLKEFQTNMMQYLPVYEAQTYEIIQKRITDDDHIQHTLDSLHDFTVWEEEGVVLFKKQCCYYYRLNPEVTASYVYAFRDMYDNPADDSNEVSEGESE